MATATAITIGVVVIVIPIRTAATTNAILPAADSATAFQARCHPCRVGGPVGSVVVDNNTVAADTPAASPLPPLGATDPTVAATTKTLDCTVAATTKATAATATATEEEECNGCNGTDLQRRLDDSLLRLADEILLRSIAATTAPQRGGGVVWQPRRR
jgi:hypothetical protein